MDHVSKGLWVVSAKIRVGNEPYNYTPVTRFCFAKKKNCFNLQISKKSQSAAFLAGILLCEKSLTTTYLPVAKPRQIPLSMRSGKPLFIFHTWEQRKTRSPCQETVFSVFFIFHSSVKKDLFLISLACP